MASRNIFQIINFIQYITRKERGVFLTYQEGATNLDNAQMSCFEEWFKPYGENQEVHDSLRPFRVIYQFTSDGGGNVNFPVDYLHLLGTITTISGSTLNSVNLMNEDELPFAIDAQLRPKSLTEPIAVDIATGFRIYPQAVQIGYFTYLRRPNIPVCSITQVGRVITYDAANSVQLEWSDSYINLIIAKALTYVGVNTDEAGIYQFAEQYQNENK